MKNKKEMLKELYSVLKEGWFPHANGDELFDLILKKKCRIYGTDEPFTIEYSNGKRIRIKSKMLYKRYVNLFQMTKVKDGWAEKYISYPKNQ